jgi:hypothetical protein
MFYLSSAATIPATGVDSMRPDLLTSDLHTVLFRGSLSGRLRDLRSSSMHCDQVFVGLPRFPGQGIFILVIVLMQSEERITCPYHLSRLMRRASVTSCIPSLAQTNAVGVSLPGLVLQFQRIIVLSFLRSLCRSPAVGVYVLLPCSNAERTHASNALPLVVMDKCLDVRIGRSFSKFPQAVQHLAAMARVHPPQAHNMSPR